MAGLQPNDFYWVIEGKLAVSECIGGGGLTSRKIRREEEIQWLKSQGIMPSRLSRPARRGTSSPRHRTRITVPSPAHA